MGQFEFRSVLIPKGFKLIAVGERCATPTGLIDRRDLTLKGSHSPARVFDLSGSVRPFLDNSVGVAQRSPTAINLNPSGIDTSNRQTDSYRERKCQQFLYSALPTCKFAELELFSSFS
jgi:hypothetical protein